MYKIYYSGNRICNQRIPNDPLVRYDFTNFFYYFRQIKNHIVLYLFYSIKGDRVFEYEGDRTRDDIVNFALRVMGPAVTQLNTIGDFEEAKKRTELFFMFSGESEGSEWV